MKKDSIIVLDHVTKKFGNKTVINDISLEIERGSFVVFLGASGGGKTTSLKMINKLIPITSGTVTVNGEDVEKTNTIALRRKIGYVIQDVGLFPLMTIFENMSIVLRLEGVPKEERYQRSKELIEMIGLPEDMLQRYPDELSGGQQQRIGFARALANGPEIILMDEPFSALDPITRTQLQDEIIEIHQTLGITIIFVTHSIDEALRLADKICVFEKGEIAQYATPQEILNRPANEYVRNFIGENKLWQNPEYINISDIMLANPIVISNKATILMASQKMRAQNVDMLLVVDRHAQFYGVLEMEQLLQTKFDPDGLVGDMLRTDLKTLSPNTTVDIAIEIIIENEQSIIPVVDQDNKLLGIVTRARLFKNIGTQFISKNDEGGHNNDTNIL